MILLSHQECLLDRCRKLEQGNVMISDSESINTKIGIIGDKSGSGKSFVILALALDSNPPKKELNKYFADNLITITVHTSPAIGPNVIVFHHSLMTHWKRCIQLYRPNARVLYLAKKKDLENVNIEEYDIVLLNSYIYTNFCIKYKYVVFKRLFIDEADSLILTASIISASFYWFVSSSYHSLIYPYGHQTWNERLQIYYPFTCGIKYLGFVRDLFVHLHHQSEVVTQFILMKNEDKFVDDSCKIFDPISTIIFCRNPFLQENLFNASLSKMSSVEDLIEKSIIESSGTSSEQNIRKRIMSEICPICFDMIKQKAILLCCSNAFCTKCIGKWITNSKVCPSCRTYKTLGDIHVVQNDIFKDPGIHAINEEQSTLMNTLNIINNGKNNKVIIYFDSEYEFPSSVIIPHLILSNIKYAFLKGNAVRYDKILYEYSRTHQQYVLFFDSTYYGSGLDLKNTTDIIFFNKFDTEIEKKVIGCAQRLGREFPLRVWYLIHKKNTLDYI